MNHIVIPLAPAHVHAFTRLVVSIGAAAGLDCAEEALRPHVTVVAYDGLAPEVCADALRSVTEATLPFTIHAHGYGLFTGPQPSDLSLHVPVVRSRPLDDLHAAVSRAVVDSGGAVASWSGPDLWSPHITLLDRCLDGGRLAEIVATLSSRPQPSWRIPVARIAVTGGWAERDSAGPSLRLGSGRPIRIP